MITSNLSTVYDRCSGCSGIGLEWFDIDCDKCLSLLTSTFQILSVMREWSSPTQQSLYLLIDKLRSILDSDTQRMKDLIDIVTGMPILHFVIRSGAAGIGNPIKAATMCKRLIDEGFSASQRNVLTNMNALHVAALYDVPSAVTDIVCAESGIIDSVCGEYSMGTSLHIAASNLSCDTARQLLTNGANPHLRDTEGRTAFECLPDESSLAHGSSQLALYHRLRTLLSEYQNNDLTGFSTLPAKTALKAIGLRLGDKVILSKDRVGWLRYCGPVEFAPGLWAGVELIKPEGRNDGSVNGVSYFYCSSNYGVFAPLSRISSHKPQSSVNTLHGASKIQTDYSKQNLSKRALSTISSRGSQASTSGSNHHHQRKNFLNLIQNGGFYENKSVNNDDNRISNTSTTINESIVKKNGDIASFIDNCHSSQDVISINDRVIIGETSKGVVRFVGETKFAQGLWYGVELDEAVGKNDGSVNGIRYFRTEMKRGIFAPKDKISKLYS